MASPFGTFVHTSPLSSLPHDATLTLASNCIRDTFGPTVQTVADCLVSRGGASTFAQLVSTIRGQCRRVWNEERERLVSRGSSNNSKHKLYRAKGPATAGYVVETKLIRQALLILIQLDLVEISSTTTLQNKPTYQFLIHRARLLPRYPKYTEYIKKVLDETAATLVEELLIHGRCKTVDAIVVTVNRLQQDSSVNKSEKYTIRQSVVERFRQLVQGGFIEEVPPLQQNDNTTESEEFEFGAKKPPAVRFEVQADVEKKKKASKGDDPAVVGLLNQGPYRNILPRESVWRINVEMFHETFRAFSLGRLVAERFGQKVTSCGSMITAALKLASNKKHADKLETFEQQHEFTPSEIIPYLPKPVQQLLEKKPGGIVKNLSSALVDVTNVTYPSVLIELEETGRRAGVGKFQVATPQLVDYLRGRIYHQVILDSHGEVAARICSILIEKGHLEADTIAEMAMVPAKDTREILHQLYRANYVTLLTLNQSKQHNTASMIFLWTVQKRKLHQIVSDNVCRALTNIRLRRQHEESVGKDLIERAKEANDADVNEQEMDKANYTKFCLGLERLDNACLQLDETLMVLLDF